MLVMPKDMQHSCRQMFTDSDSSQMKIYIDLSVMTVEPSAGGRVSGVLDLAAVPSIQATLVLTRPSDGVQFPLVNGFTGHLRVEGVRFEPATTDVSVALSLEDVVVPTRSDAKEVMRFLVDGFGLSAEEFD
jgi:hypothetical protein